MVERHTHNRVDSPAIEFTDLSILPESAIALPTGGAVIDAEARTAIASIITAMQNKRLLE